MQPSAVSVNAVDDSARRQPHELREVTALLADLAREHADTQALLDRTAALRALPDALRAAVGADVAFVGTGETPGSVVLRNLSGLRGDWLRGLEIGTGLGLGGKSLASLAPQWVSDYETAATITHEFDGPVTAEGLRGVIAVPLVHAGQVFGVAYASMRRPATFGDVAISRLLQVADRAAAGLHVAQAAESQAEVAVQTERRRLAADLHDSLGAMLFSIGAQVHDLREQYPDGGDLVDRLQRIETQVSEATSALRQSLTALHRTEAGQSLAVTVQADCAAFQQRTGVMARAIVLSELPEVELHRSTALVSTAREAMLNVEKHAQASSVIVTLAHADGGLLLAVTDDGAGTDSSASGAGGGLGIPTSAERVERIGGRLSLVANDDAGMTMRAWIPLS